MTPNCNMWEDDAIILEECLIHLKILQLVIYKTHLAINYRKSYITKSYIGISGPDEKY